MLTHIQRICQVVAVAVVVFLLITAHMLPVQAQIVAASLVMDEETGAVLAATNPDLPRAAASVTKLMTAAIFLEHAPPWARRIKMLKADEVGGGRLRLRVGTIVTVRDLFYAALVGSANNSANALARITGLSHKLFIHEMNVRAAVLGMRHTTFADASGMSQKNMSTARDLAILARYTFRNPDISAAVGSEAYTFTPVASRTKKTIVNTNSILGDAGTVTITGGKTGFTDEAGYNLIIRAEASGRRLIVVVLGAASKQAAAAEARALAEAIASPK